MKRSLARAVRVALWLVALDVVAVVVSGGVSLIGPVTDVGFGIRVGIVVVLLGLDAGMHRDRRRAALYGYLAMLLLLVALLHTRGYRLRGDGLWYYSYAHSVAFDGDIDLTNQYERLGIEDKRGSQSVPQTGRARYTYPVGAPLSWVPFLLGPGHAGAALRNAYGIRTAYDGFSDPYFHAVALGSLGFGWAGLLVLDGLLRKWFAGWVAFLTSAGIGLGTFLAWYLAYHAIYTHTLTFLLVALFLKRWLDAPESLRDYSILGLLLGLAACVRWQNGVFALLPAGRLAKRMLGGAWREALARGLTFGGMVVLGLLPQFVSWKLIFDRFYIGVPLGEGYMRWADPFWTEMLFSSRHGLLSWSPLLALALVGLVFFVRREPRIGLPLTGMLVLLTYVNSSVADWWGGGSFGARRFDSTLPILALGLATTIAWAEGFVERHARTVVAGVVVVFLLLNGLLMEQYRKGRIPVDATLSWQSAAEGMLEDVFDAVGYPFSFPMNWLFAYRYDRPKTQYDILVGNYLFHRMNSLSGVIDIGETDPPFIGNGWSGVRDFRDRKRAVRLATGPRAGVFVPTDRAEALRVEIECAVPAGESPIPVRVFVNGFQIGVIVPDGEMRWHEFTAAAPLWKRLNLLELVPLVETEGAPYLAVDRFRFERLAP